MMILSLAARNLMRNRRRSLATLLAMSIGSVAILLFGGFSSDIKYEMLSNIVQTGGHLQIQHRDFYLYGSGNPTAYGIEDYEKIIKDISSDPVLKDIVNVTTPMLQFGGIAGNYSASVSRTVMGTGFVAKDINRMRTWNEYGLKYTPSFSALDGTSEDAAVVGVGVARVLQMCEVLGIQNCPVPEKEAKNETEGEAVTLPDDVAQISSLESNLSAQESVQITQSVPTSQSSGALPKAASRQLEMLVVNSRGAPNVMAVEVIRAEDQGIKELDEVAVIMHLFKIQKLVYGSSAPKVTSIVIQLKHTDHLALAMQRLKPILERYSNTQPLVMRDYKSLNPFFVQTMQMFDTIFGFVFVLIGAIVLFTVGNTMNTAIVERTVEIGTLRAIGLRQGGIRSLFMAEGALLGVSGSLAGVALTFVCAYTINTLSIPWTPPTRVNSVPLVILLSSETNMIIFTAIALIVIAILSAWLPAYRAANLKVVEALRHV